MGISGLSWDSKAFQGILRNIYVFKFFDSMFSLESDKITALLPGDSLTLIFYVKFSNSTPNWKNL